MAHTELTGRGCDIFDPYHGFVLLTASHLPPPLPPTSGDIAGCAPSSGEVIRTRPPMVGHALLSQIDALLKGHTQQSAAVPDPSLGISPCSRPTSAAKGDEDAPAAGWAGRARCAGVSGGWWCIPPRRLSAAGDGVKTSLGGGGGGDIGSIAPKYAWRPRSSPSPFL